MNVSAERLKEIYGEVNKSKCRFEKVEAVFKKEFGESKCQFFSAPGRTEIVGNHTDHNGGKVIAGSISMDTIAAATPNNSNIIEIISEGYTDKIVVDLDKYDCNIEKAKSKALILGIAEATKRFNYNISGFSAYVSTNVIAASGVSSSASFEMLICSIINYFFNEGKMNYVEYAKIGQYAENKYWGKKSGLMDQLACAVGGIICLDFKGEVSYQKVSFDFSKFKYKFILVNSEMDHADLSDEYSAVPKEMYEVAEALGVKRLCDTTFEDVLANFENIRRNVRCDRALLRAFHFYKENERVDQMLKAMEDGDMNKILNIIKESGNSSWKYLQNCYVPGNTDEQSVPLNLLLTEMQNEQIKGVCRVHGGGFSGVILEVVPEENAEKYVEYMIEKVGEKKIYSLEIRSLGAIHV